MLIFRNEIEQEIPQDDSASEGEKLFLYGLIRAMKPNIVVETGTHRGKTALYMAHALFDNAKGHLHTYDPFDTWGQIGNFRKFPELEPYVTYYKERGDSCSVKNIDLWFCDGYHSEQDVVEELQVILPLLSKYGVVVFHDCALVANDGVNLAVEKMGLKNVWIPTQNTIRIYQHANV
jgi:predicted O-methyltransferase YrrM